jgi:hypothetical protein
MDAQKAHLEGIYNEYLQYKEHYVKNYISVEDRRKKIAEKIDAESDKETIANTVFENNYKVTMQETDLHSILTKLAITTEAYQDLFEIPQEIKTAVESYKPLRYYAIKNGEEIELNPELKEQQIKALIEQL